MLITERARVITAAAVAACCCLCPRAPGHSQFRRPLESAAPRLPVRGLMSQ